MLASLAGLSHAVIRQSATSSCGRCENLSRVCAPLVAFPRCANEGVGTLQDGLACSTAAAFVQSGHCTCLPGGGGVPRTPIPSWPWMSFSPPKTDIDMRVRRCTNVNWALRCGAACAVGHAGTVQVQRQERREWYLVDFGPRCHIVSAVPGHNRHPSSPPTIFTGPSVTTLRLFLISVGDRWNTTADRGCLFQPLGIRVQHAGGVPSISPMVSWASVRDPPSVPRP